MHASSTVGLVIFVGSYKPTKQTQIRVSEIFAVFIFMVSESGAHAVACRSIIVCGERWLFINPRRACAARITVLSLCVCVCVCVCVSVTQHLTFQVFIRAINDTNLLGGG